MTKGELSEISIEVRSISQELEVLDDANIFENRRIDWLTARLDYLDAQLDSALTSKKKMRFKVVGQNDSCAAG